MQLSFMKINNIVSTLVQQPDQLTGQAAFKNSKTQLFAQTLQQVLTPGGSTREMAGKHILDEKATLEQAKKMLLNEAVPEQGLPFLSKLQAVFLKLSGGNLKNITLDAPGLDALKNMLLKAGFEPKDVDGVILDLTEKALVKDLNLQEVMDHLVELSPGDETHPEPDETILETSALPFVIAILNSLGLSEEMTREITSQADRGQQGISLDVIITRLKAIEVQSFYTGQPYKTQGQDTSFEKLFAQLGLGLPGDTPMKGPVLIMDAAGAENNPLIESAGYLNAKSDPSEPALSGNRSAGISLSHFLRSLETFQQNLIDTQGQAKISWGTDQNYPMKTDTREPSHSAIDALLNTLAVKSEKITVPSFSYFQIKDQFKNDLLIPDKEMPNKNGLFSQNRSNSDLKPEQVLNEIESRVFERSNPLADPRPRFKEGATDDKGIKPQAANRGDLTGMALNKKAEVSQAGTASNMAAEVSQAALKTKSAVQNLATQVIHQVGDSLVKAITQGETILKIQLMPPELGRLVMAMDNVGTSMKVSIAVERPAAQDFLISRMDELKTVLVNAGIRLEKFDVDLNSDFRQAFADDKNQSGNFSRKDQNSGKSLFFQTQPVLDLPSEQVSQISRGVESILSPKSSPIGDILSNFKGGEKGGKDFKPDGTREEGLTQGTALDMKAEASLAALKTKSLFQNLPTHVTLQVGKSLIRAINQGEHILKIQLKPTELGRLVMIIDNVGNSMKVSITTESPMAKDILISHMNELKTVLANAGISLEKFDVDLNSDFKQTYADHRNPSDNSSRKGPDSEKSLFDAINLENINDPGGALAAATRNGSYHFVA